MIISRGRADGTAPTQRRTETFDGTVWADPVLPTTDGVTLNQVFFPPRSRTHWHRHEHGQILVVTIGAGHIQSRGGPVEDLRAGDTVWIPPGETHWHGAGAATFLSHLAISLGTTEWLDPVTDGLYPEESPEDTAQDTAQENAQENGAHP